jgi:hypothetical protein
MQHPFLNAKGAFWDFLEYAYTLPRMIDDLNQKLDAFGQEEEHANQYS